MSTTSATSTTPTETYTFTLDWHDRGGLVGRGVLIDYKAYADANGISYDPFSDHRITVADIETIAKSQGVEFRQGDIIIVRSGFTEALGTMSAEEQDKALGTHRTCGVEGTDESAKWFWNKHFAAVAGDALAFEAIPPIIDGKEETVAKLGMSIAPSRCIRRTRKLTCVSNSTSPVVP